MKVIICDDEEKCLEKCRKLLRECARISRLDLNIKEFANARDLLTYCREGNEMDIIILDIVMQINGIEVARRIRKYDENVRIIFLSHCNKYAIQGYSVRAEKYLLKTSPDEFLIRELNEVLVNVTPRTPGSFIERIGKSRIKIPFEELIYVETYGRKTRMHTKDKEITSTKTMKEHTKALDDKRFGRCHAAFIVNMDYIQEVKDTEIVLHNGCSLPVSKGKKKEFLHHYLQYQFGTGHY